MTTDIFRVGDWVKIDDWFGHIQHIFRFYTPILSPLGETHIFPNDGITTRDISTLAHNRYRNDVLVETDYDSNIPRAIEVCNAVLQKLTDAEQNHLDGINPTSVKSFVDFRVTLAVILWIRHPNSRAINQPQTTVFAEHHQRFQDKDIDIRFPSGW